MSTSLQEAEANLKRAQADAAEQSRKQDMQKLRDAATQGRAASDEYERLHKSFRRCEANVALLRRDLDAMNQRIAEHAEEKPQVWEFPSEDEIATWEQQQADLIRARDALSSTTLRIASVEMERVRMLAIEAAGRVDQCQLTVRNLRNRLEPNVSSVEVVSI